MDAGGMNLTTNGGVFNHHRTQASTYTIASGEGTVLAGPLTITGTVTNAGTMVILSTLQVNTINENTSGNGNIDSFVGDGILMSPQTISTELSIQIKMLC